MNDSPQMLVVFSTFPDAEAAREVARTLVQEHLAACAQVLSAPIRSFYSWEGRVRDDEETLVLLKTSAERWEELRGRLQVLHPYEVPQIVACPAQASDSYLQWLLGNCSS